MSERLLFFCHSLPFLTCVGRDRYVVPSFISIQQYWKESFFLYSTTQFISFFLSINNDLLPLSLSWFYTLLVIQCDDKEKGEEKRKPLSLIIIIIIMIFCFITHKLTNNVRKR